MGKHKKHYYPFNLESILCIFVVIFLWGPIGGGVCLWILGKFFGVELGFISATKIGFVAGVACVAGFSFVEWRLWRKNQTPPVCRSPAPVNP